MFNIRPARAEGTSAKSAHQQRLRHPDLRHQQPAEDAHERHEHVPRRGGRVRVPRRREAARAERAQRIIHPRRAEEHAADDPDPACARVPQATGATVWERRV